MPSTSVIIGGMMNSNTSWINGIFRPRAMPIANIERFGQNQEYS